MSSTEPPPSTRFSPQQLEVLRPLRSGAAQSRAALAKHAGLSPSTITARVDELLRLGHVIEVGDGVSAGGRRPRRLAIRADAGAVGSFDLGVDRTSIGLLDFGGDLLGHTQISLDVALGPTPVLERLWRELNILIDGLGRSQVPPLKALSIGVPGPVSATASRIQSPSRMPGWNGNDPASVLTRLSGLPVLVGNDANLMALGEYAAGEPGQTNQVFVKAGSGIGCGIICRGALFVGADGAAGDISHVAVPDAPPVACSCGRRGCLDALASGNALVRELQEAGLDVPDVEAMIDLANDADPSASQLIRQAGAMTGGVLSTIVNFFNPDRLILGGVLSRSEVFVSAVRSTIYADCLPMATKKLTIATPRLPTTAGLVGGAQAVLDRIFSSEQF